MVTRSHGFRVGTRKRLSKKTRDKGRIKIRKVLQEFKPNDRVIIDVDSSVHKGMPHKRFFGKHGVILERRGNAYMIKIKGKGNEKTIICSTSHLRKD